MKEGYRRGLGFVLVLAAFFLVAGGVISHGKQDQDSAKTGVQVPYSNVFLTMIKTSTYPEMKEVLERQIGLRVNKICRDYVSYEDEHLKNHGSNQLEFSFLDVDLDGRQECLVANMIPVYEIGAVVIVYKEEEGKVRLLGQVEMGATHEDFEGLLPPFDGHKKGDSLLYSNPERKELYTCQYETGLVRKQVNRRYQLEKGAIYETYRESLPMTEKAEKGTADAFVEIGKAVPFYTYEQIIEM